MMQRTLLILGAGGHGKAVAEAALLSGDWLRVMFVDDRWSGLCESFGLPVVANLVGVADAAGQADAAIATVGNNILREHWQAAIRAVGLPLAAVVHPRACVSHSATIGVGTAIMAMVGVDVQVGEGVIVNAGAIVDHDATLGDFAHLGAGVSIAGGVQIGDRAWLQAGCCAGNRVAVSEGALHEPGTTLSV